MTVLLSRPLAVTKSVVRPWRLADAAAIAVHANNRSIWKHLRDAFPHPYSVTDAERYITSVASAVVPSSFVVEVEGDPAGSVGFRFRDDVERIGGEIGYWLGAKYWGRGIMTEVVQAMTPWALDQYHWVRVFALPFAGNVGSHRVLERAGYVLEGRMRRNAYKDGEVVDQLLYGYVEDRAWP